MRTLRRNARLYVASLSLVLLTACGSTAPQPRTEPVFQPEATDESPAKAPPAAPTRAIPPGTPAQLEEQGLAALRDLQFEDAIYLLTEAVRQEPSLEDAQRALVTTLVRTGRPAEAVAAAEAWHEAEQDSTAALEARVRALLLADRARDARGLIEAYTEGNPDDLDMRNLQVEVGIALGFHERAVRESAEILKKDEVNPKALRNIARAYIALGKTDLALFVIGQGLRAQEGDPDPTLNYLLGLIYIERKDWQRAAAALEESVRARPGFAPALNNLGLVYQQVGDYPSAMQTLRRAVEVAPGYRHAWLNLGNAYRGSKNFAGARSAYERALELDVRYADAWFNLGILFFENTIDGMEDEKRLQQAVKHFNEYKLTAGARLKRDDPVDTYIAEAKRMIEAAQQAKAEQMKQPPEDEGGGDDTAPEQPEDGDGESEDQPLDVDPLPDEVSGAALERSASVNGVA